MSHWTEPLSPERIHELIEANKRNGPVTVMEGPIGPMVKVECTTNVGPEYLGKVYYCGGEGGDLWLEERRFYEEYPHFQEHQKMPEPEFDLDDMELAEIIMEELK